MPRNTELGEFEQLVLLSVMRLRDEAYAPQIARALEEKAGREMSRGTLYAALARLETRDFLEWDVEEATVGRSGDRRRRFRVTPEGARALASTRRVLLGMWDGIEHLLPEEGA